MTIEHVTVLFELKDDQDSQAVDQFIKSRDDLRRVTDQAQMVAVDPLTWALIIGAGAALTAVVLDYFERSQGGMMVDCTKDPVQVSRDSGVLPNTILIILKDGSIKIENVDPKSSVAEKIFSEILQLTVSSTVDKVKQITDAAGLTAKVED